MIVKFARGDQDVAVLAGDRVIEGVLADVFGFEILLGRFHCFHFRLISLAALSVDAFVVAHIGIARGGSEI